MGKTKAKAVVKKPVAKLPAKISDNKRIKEIRHNICETWQAAVESILATGEQLIEAKAELKGYPKGSWTALCDGLPFTERTAQMLMKIASSPQLADPKHASLLPPSWYTLYQLTQLDDKTLKQAIAKGKVNPGMERSDVEKLLEASKPKIDPEAEDAEVIENDDEPEGNDDNGDEETEVEDEEDGDDDGDKPEPKGKAKEETGHVGPKLSRHDKKVDYVADALELCAHRLGQFEEMLEASQEVRDAMKSKMSRDMLKRAQEISLIIDRLTKKYLKG